MLSHKVQGDGPPLLLIHGWGVTYNLWQNLEPYLKAYFKLIMIELPGMGGSSPADPGRPYYEACAAAIEELRRALDIERWAVLSYSTGTRAAEAYIRRDAPHVERGAFLCPAYLSAGRSLGLRILVQLDRRWPRKGDWIISDWRLYNLVVLLCFNGRRHPLAVDWTDEIATQPLIGLKTSLREFPHMGRRPFELPGLPTLFVWGSDDNIVTRPRHPRANDRIIPAAHSAPMLAAPAVAEAVLPFLR